MCVETFAGCPNCGQPADDQVYERAYQTERILYPLTSDGDRDEHAEANYDECPDFQYDGYQCSACGWEGGSLDNELSRECCECSECVEPEYDEVVDEDADEDAYVTLRVRTGAPIEELPLELRILAEDRCAWVALIPRWRSAELYSDWSHLISVEYNPPYSVCESDARALMPTYPAYDDREVCTA